jgi:hypothetical protein
MFAENLDNVIAILVLSKNTSRAQNFLHNALLFLLICAMLQYSLVDHKRSTSYLNIWQILKSKTPPRPTKGLLMDAQKKSIGENWRIILSSKYSELRFTV